MFADYMAYSQPLFSLNGIKTDGARRLIDIYWPWYLASGNIVIAMDMRSEQIVGVLTGFDVGQWEDKIDQDAFDEWVEEQEGAEGMSNLQMGLIESLYNEHERLKEDGRANEDMYRCGGNIAVRRDVIQGNPEVGANMAFIWYKNCDNGGYKVAYMECYTQYAQMVAD